MSGSGPDGDTSDGGTSGAGPVPAGTSLAERSCPSCRGELPRLSRDEALALLGQLDAGWALDEAATEIARRFEVKGFAKAAHLASLAAFHADRQGHHPDIAFGWGYCRVSYTTHDVDGLTESDFICAAKLERLLAV